ncbi:MAG: hypothetical protein EXR45_02835 [Chloroflexi bacterium]|nr:hypothetical protein [Chloroflexota bacterium]
MGNARLEFRPGGSGSPAIAHASTLRARVPFLHFFDAFRTSHEVMKISPLSNDTLHAMIDDDLFSSIVRGDLPSNIPISPGRPRTRMSSSRHARLAIRTTLRSLASCSQ